VRDQSVKKRCDHRWCNHIIHLGSSRRRLPRHLKHTHLALPNNPTRDTWAHPPTTTHRLLPLAHTGPASAGTPATGQEGSILCRHFNKISLLLLCPTHTTPNTQPGQRLLHRTYCTTAAEAPPNSLQPHGQRENISATLVSNSSTQHHAYSLPRAPSWPGLHCPLPTARGQTEAALKETASKEQADTAPPAAGCAFSVVLKHPCCLPQFPVCALLLLQAGLLCC
jgi:hypothetical protein